MVVFGGGTGGLVMVPPLPRRPGRGVALVERNPYGRRLPVDGLRSEQVADRDGSACPAHALRRFRRPAPERTRDRFWRRPTCGRYATRSLRTTHLSDWSAPALRSSLVTDASSASGKIAVGETSAAQRTAVIATGSRPALPAGPGGELFPDWCRALTRSRLGRPAFHTGGEPPRSSLVRPPMRGTRARAEPVLARFVLTLASKRKSGTSLAGSRNGTRTEVVHAACSAPASTLAKRTGWEAAGLWNCSAVWERVGEGGCPAAVEVDDRRRWGPVSVAQALESFAAAPPRVGSRPVG